MSNKNIQPHEILTELHPNTGEGNRCDICDLLLPKGEQIYVIETFILVCGPRCALEAQIQLAADYNQDS
jgi:hypothetical protein